MAWASTNPYTDPMLEGFDEIDDAALDAPLQAARTRFSTQWRDPDFAQRRMARAIDTGMVFVKSAAVSATCYLRLAVMSALIRLVRHSDAPKTKLCATVVPQEVGLPDPPRPKLAEAAPGW